MTNLLVDGFSNKITRACQELRVLVCPSGLDLSSSTLQHLAEQLAVRRRQMSTRGGDACPRPPAPARPGPPAVRRHLRSACRRLRNRDRLPVHKAKEVPAVRAPPLAHAMETGLTKAFVIVVSTLCCRSTGTPPPTAQESTSRTAMNVRGHQPIWPAALGFPSSARSHSRPPPRPETAPESDGRGEPVSATRAERREALRTRPGTGPGRCPCAIPGHQGRA